MFTGIVKALGRVRSMDATAAGARLVIECPRLKPGHITPGDSIAVAGVCLTALEPTPDSFAADVSNETLELTSLGGRRPGDAVNLEPALAAGEPLGGHLVTGHVDGTALLASRRADGDSVRMRFVVPAHLVKYMAGKGSVTLDGVSLTINHVEDTALEVNVIPHTLEATTLGSLEENEPVNLEVDLVARYLERLLQARGS